LQSLGILSSVVLVSLNSAKAKARDAIRKADLKQLEIALDFNYDKWGAYTQPENMYDDTSYGGTATDGSFSYTGNWDDKSDLRDLIEDGFISTLPLDPLNDTIYQYRYEPWNAGEDGYAKAGQAYDLCAALESGGYFCIKKR